MIKRKGRPRKVKSLADVELELNREIPDEAGSIDEPQVITGYSVGHARNGIQSNGSWYDRDSFGFCNQILREMPLRGRDRFIFELHTQGFTANRIEYWLKRSIYPGMQVAGVNKRISQIKDEFEANIYPTEALMGVDRNALILMARTWLDRLGVGERVGVQAKAVLEDAIESEADLKFAVLSAYSRLD